MRLRRRVVGMLACIVLGVALTPQAAHAGIHTFTFQLDLGDPCFSGHGHEDARHSVSLLTPDGHIRDQLVVRSRGDRFRACFALDMNPNDRLRVRSQGDRRTFRIPDIKPFVDRTTDKVKGRAPAGTEVMLMLADDNDLVRTVVADDDGWYRTDFTSKWDIRGTDPVIARWQHEGDEVLAVQITPFVIFNLVDDVVHGAANRGADVSIELLNRDGLPRGDARGEPDQGGQFETFFRDPAGTPVYPRRGDRIVAPAIASDVDLLVPAMSIRPDLEADVVRARCAPDARFFMLIQEEVNVLLLHGRADGTGRLEKFVGDRLDIRRGTNITLQCQYPTGDVIERWLRVP